MENFKSIPELIQSLNQLALRINKGSVGLEEFETTLRDARELYERLVILRYKAIEDRNLMGVTSGKPSDPEDAEEIQHEAGLGAKQISLIDSIEEIAREAGVAHEETPQRDPEPSAEQEEPIVKDEEVPRVDPPQTASKEETGHSEVIPPSAKVNPESTRPDSLADKLSQTRIDDLTVAIGLNQKFQFIKELFEGNAEAYNQAVEKLNKSDSREEALDYLHNEVKEPRGWDEEDDTAQAFLQLVERRYA